MALYSFQSKFANQRNKMVKAVFFDRDGVLNHLVEHGDQFTAPWDVSEFDLMPGAKAAVDLVKSNGYLAFVVTNQPDVLDGYLAQHHLNIMNRLLKAWLRVDDILIAYERGSAWYKPNNGMFETLIKSYNVDRNSSYIIGDRWKDIVPGHKSGLSTIFLGEEYHYPLEHKKIQPDYICENVLQACKLIVKIDEAMEPKYD
jgi:UDP-N-acetylmuramoyl-tripeptide--D-alanyl-D-alanine ligase